MMMIDFDKYYIKTSSNCSSKGVKEVKQDEYVYEEFQDSTSWNTTSQIIRINVISEANMNE